MSDYAGPVTVVQDGAEREIDYCELWSRSVPYRQMTLIEWRGRFETDEYIDHNAATRLRLPDGREGVALLDFPGQFDGGPFRYEFTGSGEPPF